MRRGVIEFLASGKVQFEKKIGDITIVHAIQRVLGEFRLPFDGPELRRWLAGADLVDCVHPKDRDYNAFSERARRGAAQP